jgi:AcrR family transcriptional regulator
VDPEQMLTPATPALLHIGVDAVNISLEMSENARTRYHHGNLREALVESGVELARAGGPDAVVVREASRRVGVSHNAAYRHFPDRDALLDAVAARCMSIWAGLMEQFIDRVDPGDLSVQAARRRLHAVGEAYVRFALSEPGLFRTAFAAPGSDQPPQPTAGVGQSGLGPYGLLGAQLDGLVAAGVLPPSRRPEAEITCWAAVHGLSMLFLEGPLRGLPEPAREAALTRLVVTVEQGLTAGDDAVSARAGAGGGSDAARTPAR